MWSRDVLEHSGLLEARPLHWTLGAHRLPIAFWFSGSLCGRAHTDCIRGLHLQSVWRSQHYHPLECCWAGASWPFTWILVPWTWHPLSGSRMDTVTRTAASDLTPNIWWLQKPFKDRLQKAVWDHSVWSYLRQAYTQGSWSCIRFYQNLSMDPDLSTDFPGKGFSTWVSLNEQG